MRIELSLHMMPEFLPAGQASLSEMPYKSYMRNTQEQKGIGYVYIIFN